MNKYIRSFIVLGICLGILSSCSNFDEINNDPNATNQVAPGLLATGLLIGMTKQDYEYGSFIDHNFMSKHAITAELIRNELYNKISRSGFDSFWLRLQLPKTGCLTRLWLVLLRLIKAFIYH